MECLSNWASGVTCTCLTQRSGQRHPDQPPGVLEPLAQGFLHHLQGAVLVPHRQLQALHAVDDTGPLLWGEKASLAGHVHHKGHVDVHRFTVQQGRQHLLQGRERETLSSTEKY